MGCTGGRREAAVGIKQSTYPLCNLLALQIHGLLLSAAGNACGFPAMPGKPGVERERERELRASTFFPAPRKSVDAGQVCYHKWQHCQHVDVVLEAGG